MKLKSLKLIEIIVHLWSSKHTFETDLPHLVSLVCFSSHFLLFHFLIYICIRYAFCSYLSQVFQIISPLLLFSSLLNFEFKTINSFHLSSPLGWLIPWELYLLFREIFPDFPFFFISWTISAHTKIDLWGIQAIRYPSCR